MMKKTIMMAAVAAFIASPALANEAKMDEKVNKWFSEIDTNGNGSISKEEHNQFSENMFEEADTDNNGTVSKEELRAKKMEEKEQWKDKKNM